jgi:hypothetical protein
VGGLRLAFLHGRGFKFGDPGWSARIAWAIVAAMTEPQTIARERFRIASMLLEHALELLGPCDAVTIIVHGAAGEPEQAIALQTTVGSRAAVRGVLMSTVGETLLADGFGPDEMQSVAMRDAETWSGTR